MANGILKVGEITTSSGSGNITIGSGVTINVNRPAFYAYLTAVQSIANATYTKANLDAVLYNEGSGYDTSNYKFTVPSGQAGKYLFSAKMKISGIDDNEASLSVDDYVEMYVRHSEGSSRDLFAGTSDGSWFIGHKLGA